MGVFCAYCGKSFTRKEHLERHLPTHTNVKPHRCSACQLSFARRDLLQRHHSTYHEVRDPMEPIPGGVPTVAGRTPIACLNCAQAKTGCDKRVPCARCSDKNLECQARFARRSSKAALRAAQVTAAAQATAAMSSIQNQIALPPPQSVPATPATTINPVFMDIDQNRVNPESAIPSSMSPENANNPITIDPRIQPHESPLKLNSPAISQMSADDFLASHPGVGVLDHFLSLSGDLIQPPQNIDDVMGWTDYNLDFDIYANNMSLQADAPMPVFNETSDLSSSSDPTGSSRASIHTRSTSIVSSGDFDLAVKPSVDMTLNTLTNAMIPEFEVVIAADAAWPLARCNPLIYSNTCPRTAIVHLECLEQKSRHEDTWNALEQYLEQVERNSPDMASVVPMTSRSRDNLLAITQTFLHKALEIHRGGVNTPVKNYVTSRILSFLVLPPSKILEYFLRSYLRNLSFFYSLLPAGCVDPNELLQNNQVGALLVLLMIAQGASAIPTAEARALSTGLLETCRISLFDIIEKDIEMCADPTTLRCALLFTLLGAWSGDKWLMDIAMGQRGMYLSMLKHAGMFEAQPSTIPTFTSSTNAELEWHSWIHREAQNRLAYNFVMVDQELSLFHDTAPMLSTSELCAPLPGPELLWMAVNVDQWIAAVQSTYGCNANVNPQLLTTTPPPVTTSLYELFQGFLNDNLPRGQGSLTPQQLRLLLHPLQSSLHHVMQMLRCFPDVIDTQRAGSRTDIKLSFESRRREIQGLLEQWYEMTMAYCETNPTCTTIKTNLVLYHLISLNAVTNFQEIERLARREGFVEGCYWEWELSLRHKRCILQREETILHSGQLLRLLRSMPRDRRPTWWSAAVYRAALILWADNVSWLDTSFQAHDESGAGSAAAAAAALDQLSPPNPGPPPSYSWNKDPRDAAGAAANVRFEKPGDVLECAIKMLEDGISSRFTDGIRRKLLAMSANWQNVELSSSTVTV
ncbi:uncharacterized protein F4812DRAFT_380629 [Daldinia caldariorum]|uniref:uncharacterized protein n=1 Tax=Daldinia caldariorum TaxID=326644 RepID=UPI002007E65A|nr:uncharacterized protein F4812DRAFT_380629 [Daldinia caldariorum]KAI1467869.1 hypothetical protein F4812DRAFT_380629 [Daldinia caldariorum]